MAPTPKMDGKSARRRVVDALRAEKAPAIRDLEYIKDSNSELYREGMKSHNTTPAKPGSAKSASDVNKRKERRSKRNTRDDNSSCQNPLHLNPRAQLCCNRKQRPPTHLLWKDKGMPKGRLYTWEEMARMGRQSPGTRSGRKLACCLCMYVEAISNRSSKDSSCAHKGLVTDWLHHTT
jgi:hypothetical protein